MSHFKKFIRKKLILKISQIQNGVLGQIRTADLPLRRRLLYPAELQGQQLNYNKKKNFYKVLNFHNTNCK